MGTAHPTINMSNYRRSKTPGGCYFFTVVTYKRQCLLTHPEARQILREVINKVKEEYPFKIDAWVLLPEHIHCIWTLPAGDYDFSKRWGLIKAGFSNQAKSFFYRTDLINKSKQKHRESTIWQRRFWEHEIRDQNDFNQHLDYIYWNPVKHDQVSCVKDWPYSSFHRDVKKGLYFADWGGNPDNNLEPSDVGE